MPGPLCPGCLSSSCWGRFGPELIDDHLVLFFERRPQTGASRVCVEKLLIAFDGFQAPLQRKISALYFSYCPNKKRDTTAADGPEPRNGKAWPQNLALDDHSCRRRRDKGNRMNGTWRQSSSPRARYPCRSPTTVDMKKVCRVVLGFNRHEAIEFCSGCG
jgi:hypothetical protein